MNSNGFVVLPNNKAKSVKLKARNMQELQLKTVTLGQERQEMEEKLQQLKESMSKEKEERGFSGWKSGQCDSLISNALTNSTKKSKEIMLQKLSAGKVKIRVLKDEPLTAPPQPPPPPPAISSRATRKNRLRGRYCGQCEVKTAGLMCAECTDDYCIGCFTKFHQKGALKVHRIIPIQTDLQTHVSTRDVVSCFQKQIDPSSDPSNLTNLNPSSSSSSSPKPSPSHTIKSNATTRERHGRPEEGTEAVAKPMQLHPDPSQVLAVNQIKEKKVEMTEEGLNRGDERGVPTDLFSGEYNEEDSARSFQEALRQWRGEKSDEAGEPMSEEAMWIPVRPVSAMATQADLASDRRAERRGRRGGEGRVPVRVEFTENSLTYLDRLLLKKHRRTPIETYHPPLAFGADLNSLPNKNTEEDTVSSLTAQEEDFRRYCASLFAVPVSSARTEPEITTPESCLTIEVLDERDRDGDGDVDVEQRTDNNIKVPSIQRVQSQVRTPVPQTAFTSGWSSRVSHSSPSPIQTSRQSMSPGQANATQKLHLSKTTGAEHSMKSSSSKNAHSRQSSTPTNETAPDQESTLSLQYTQCNPSLPLNVLHSPHSAVKMEEEEEEEELSIDSGDEMSSDSLGVASHEEDSSDEGRSTRGRPRDEERENSDIHAEGKKDFQSDEKEQLSEPLMVMHKQSAGSGSEHFSDLDVVLPLGLDVNCGHSDTPEHTHWDSHQTSPYDSEPKGSQGYWPSSSLSSYTEEHLVFEMLKDNTTQSAGIQIHSATPTRRGEISANEPGTSGSGSNRSTPTASQAPATCCLSHPISCSELGTVLRPLSQAAQEIMEICSVDQTGCEDPDLEADTTAHTLYKLEEELRLLSNETGKQTPVFGAGNSGSQYQHGNHHFTRGRDSEEQKEEDEAVQRDQQSVLLLP
uniref:B box-type domain-containing protein n=1 Tax=Sparus aurata TaxID=8175 RepID=A0A671Y7N2_SPAAU